MKQQNKLRYTHRTIVNIYIVYERGASGSFDNDPALKNSLFVAVKLSKKADFDRYRYYSYGTGIDRNEVFHFRVADLVKMQ